MTEFGFMGVDWEERINFDRLRRERLQKAKDALAQSDADVLFVFRDEDVRYLTGLRGHLGPVCAFHHSVVLPKGGEAILLTNLHAHCKTRMPWMPPGTIQTTPAGARFRSRDGAKLWADHIRSLIGDLVDGKIGVDIWTVDMEEGLKEALPKAQFVNGYNILLGAKMIKTQDELECQRAAYAITEAGMDAALRLLKPGIKECEVLAEAWRVFTNLGSEWTQCSNIVASGPYTAPYRLFTSDRVIREGDPVIIDIGACFNGYWGDITRTYLCGDIMPTKELKALHQEDYDALFAACAEARPGNTNYDIWKRIQNEHSGGMSGGHSAGVSPWEPPYLSGYHPEHTPDGTTTLRPGMIFSIEPYAGIPGIGGIRLENNVIVTDGDPDIYSTYPFDERMLDDTHPLDKTTGRMRRRYPR